MNVHIAQVNLPPAPTDPLLFLPPPPANPPTPEDVSRASLYLDEVEKKIRTEPNKCTSEDHSNALVYSHQITQAASMAAAPAAPTPPWFGPAMEIALAPMRASLNNLTINVSRQTNFTRDNGIVIPYEIVPFMDGTSPIDAAPPLPPLHSLQDVDALTGQQVLRYLAGYGINPPVAANRNETSRLRKVRLKTAIAGRVI